MRNRALQNAAARISTVDSPARAIVTQQIGQAIDSAQIAKENDTRFIELSRQAAEERGQVATLSGVSETNFTIDGNTDYGYVLEGAGYFIGGGGARRLYAQLTGPGHSGVNGSSVFRRIFYDGALNEDTGSDFAPTSSGGVIGHNDWLADGHWLLRATFQTRRRSGNIRLTYQADWSFDRADTGMWIRYTIAGHFLETNIANFTNLRIVWDAGTFEQSRLVLRRI